MNLRICVLLINNNVKHIIIFNYFGININIMYILKNIDTILHIKSYIDHLFIHHEQFNI